jgi:hypothetical protein
MGLYKRSRAICDLSAQVYRQPFIDKEGHGSEMKLPKRIPAILDGIVERILELMQHGWRRVRIVTDHGWLLVPGKMPKSHPANTGLKILIIILAHQ